MSRAYDARRKAKRQQARDAAAEPADQRRSTHLQRLTTLIPVLIIAAVLAAAAVLGFGAVSGQSQQQAAQKVNELLAGVPQKGTTLGSPKAPLTVWVFGDLECPTVKRFFQKYLPSIVNTWVRDGEVKLEYRSLQTDTFTEEIFFGQEVAALAAGRQDKMWNFLLTFAHNQEEGYTDYATDEFLTGIALQVPGLKQDQWRRDREDALLETQVALGGQSARARGFKYTPSFSVGPSGNKSEQAVGTSDAGSLNKEFQDSLLRYIESLRAESSGDVPGLRIRGSSPDGG